MLNRIFQYGIGMVLAVTTAFADVFECPEGYSPIIKNAVEGPVCQQNGMPLSTNLGILIAIIIFAYIMRNKGGN